MPRPLYTLTVKDGLVTGSWREGQDNEGWHPGADLYEALVPDKPAIGEEVTTAGHYWANVPCTITGKRRKGRGKIKRYWFVKKGFRSTVPDLPPRRIVLADEIRKARWQPISEARFIRLLSDEDIISAPMMPLPGIGRLVTVTRWSRRGNGQGESPLLHYGHNMPDGVNEWDSRRIRIDMHVIRTVEGQLHKLEHAMVDEDVGRFKRWGLA